EINTPDEAGEGARPRLEGWPLAVTSTGAEPAKSVAAAGQKSKKATAKTKTRPRPVPKRAVL
ncbi:MAG: hypothetical protein ABIQ06_04760, partial [Caldimonas sp.]